MAKNEMPVQDSKAEEMFNLVKFMETLITLDEQHREWLEKQKDPPKENM